MRNTIRSKAMFYDCLAQIYDEVIYSIEACDSEISRISEHGADDDCGYWGGQLEIVKEKKSHFETILSKLEKL